jgi:transcription initiation factor TFIIH subunit 2
MSRAALFHAPSHGTREILLVFGALHTSDPGDIHQTIDSLVIDKIRASVISLAAQLAICRELVTRTNNGSADSYSVVLHEQHFRELMLSVTTPPITHSATTTTNSLLMMGFPSRTIDPHPTLCACHTRPSRDGYLCSRCSTKVCSLPSECPACGLTLILSTHLARSYHHLFPLVNWVEVPWRHAHRSRTCFACQKAFPAVPPPEQWERTLPDGSRIMTSSSRYECTFCHRHFCIDCDLFAHEVVHNCPGCQSGSIEQHTTLMGETEAADGLNGRRDQDGMDLDR